MCRFCCCFRPKTEAEEKSRQIDRELDTFRKQQEQIINLLMLGAGECGKSTVVKQMRIIYADGFSDNERLQHLPIIRGNAIKSIAIILKAMNTLDVAFRELLLFNPKNSSQFNYMLLRGGFSKVHSVFSRQVTEIVINVDTRQHRGTFRIIDIGGQRSQRRKWVHAFDNALFKESLQNEVHEQDNYGDRRTWVEDSGSGATQEQTYFWSARSGHPIRNPIPSAE
ncbi:guanine nucleotide-binding protein alpha-1 subunit-like [Convolutriloba macropyga]|uniref:guanine nucleotide-binding protein alpha-1 subunit-like n=1 Tax=Convolutriloba macropyga TaxID=536237 RepID=UPI003F522D8F